MFLSPHPHFLSHSEKKLGKTQRISVTPQINVSLQRESCTFTKEGPGSHHLKRAEFCPCKFIFKSLVPRPSECDHIGRESLSRSESVKEAVRVGPDPICLVFL